MMPGSPRTPRSCLDRGTRSTISEADLHALRARAWREHGVASLAITDIIDDWVRQAVINEAVRRWGPRQKETNHGR